MAKLSSSGIQLIEKVVKSTPSRIVIKQLLLVGANSNAPDVFGRTLLYKLAFSTNDNTQILNFLLDLGTHVNAIHLDNEHHPAIYGILFGPIFFGNIKYIELLVSKGADNYLI